jgi:hypothetical protein
MAKILLGVVAALFIVNYTGEIKTFLITSGVRDMVVGYLNCSNSDPI